MQPVFTASSNSLKSLGTLVLNQVRNGQNILVRRFFYDIVLGLLEHSCQNVEGRLQSNWQSVLSEWDLTNHDNLAWHIAFQLRLLPLQFHHCRLCVIEVTEVQHSNHVTQNHVTDCI